MQSGREKLEIRDICVDLDGTLIASDTLWENFAKSLRVAPLRTLGKLGALFTGRAHFKAALASVSQIDSSLLPFRVALTETLKNAKAGGARIWLVTAAHQTVADAVANTLGLFDGVYGSEGGRNLKGTAKAEFLVEKFGSGRFVYMGDSRSDFPVWRECGDAWVVGAQLGRRVERLINRPVKVIPLPGTRWTHWLRLLRVHQWSKNLLVFAPMLAGHRFLDWSAWVGALICFGCFSLAASSTYIVNDFLDMESDRKHPTKRNRAFAEGTISIPAGLAVAIGMMVVAGVGSLMVEGLSVVVLGYLVCTWLYSGALKTIALVDVFVLSLLYTSRVIGGGIATDTVPSPWLLAFCTFQFLGLAFLKRFTEFARNPDASFRGYHPGDSNVILSLGTAASFCAALVLSLWVNSETALRGYSRPLFLWAAVPVVLLWNARAWMLANRGRVHDDPIVFAIRDRGSAVLAAIAAALFAISL